jgi:hypothetical protein
MCVKVIHPNLEYLFQTRIEPEASREYSKNNLPILLLD